jgi:hypothetical protein
LVDALEADLVGPYVPDTASGPGAEEVLKLPPSRWYLTGFLVPEEGREPDDPESDDQLGSGNDEDEDETGSDSDPDPKRKNLFPASMGMSLLLPKDATEVEVTVRYAEYTRETNKESRKHEWHRQWRPAKRFVVALDAKKLRADGDGVPVPDADGIKLVGELRAAPVMPGLPAGTQAVSLFLVNRRATGEKGRRDEQHIHQVNLRVACAQEILPRPNQVWEKSADWDERVADLQFRHSNEHAVGHNVAVIVTERVGKGADERVTAVETCWLPRAEVKRVATRENADVTVSMDELAALRDGEDVRAKLAALPEDYGRWIAAQRTIELESDRRRETRDLLVSKQELARKRIARGIELLAQDPMVRDAFCLANRAMADAARARSPERYTSDAPRWRLFQLAFVLMNLDGLADGKHADRELVELIFFPTGGGKTEAYLGVIAVALLLRRMVRRNEADQGLGVAVLLRYTLRLLTLDQLGRAATLVCALELLRRAAPEKLGEVRFSVGLWVGMGATPNTLDDAAKKITEAKNNTGPNPCPLTKCPWCRRDLEPGSLTAQPKRGPEAIVIDCRNEACAFSGARQRDGLPVVFVDEQLYRELPSFVIATVDKFAMLPWRGETGALFGRVNARDGGRFYGPMDGALGNASTLVRLPGGLLPPELIVQDELHLISGPLGTMVGLYETAIESLSTRTMSDGKKVKPKILAATATVRRAQAQIQALFGRHSSLVNVFPPAGVEDSETYFAEIAKNESGRLYVGIAAQGRSLKAILPRAYSSAISAASKAYDKDGPAGQVADAYMTLVGYFNSLRELGGMRRLVEDEVRGRTVQAEGRRPINQLRAPHRFFANRTIGLEPVELTSRESTNAVTRAKARLDAPHANVKERVDVLLASNMISVGVDIDRLGLMVVAGQPKTTAEYIQATSRVGRQDRWPGLVLTCFNVHKPRDRSHYEHFCAYHDSFYRAVEATSLTPFAGPALDRGLAGALIALTRLSTEAMTPPESAMLLPAQRALGERAVEILVKRARDQLLDSNEKAASTLAESVRARGGNLLDAWVTLVEGKADEPVQRSYSRYDTSGKGTRKLMRTPLDPVDPEQPLEAKLRAPTSMRDVESTTHLWIVGRKLGSKS